MQLSLSRLSRSQSREMIGIPQSEVLRAASRERRSQPRQRSPSRSAVGGYPVSINRGQRLNSRAAILRSKKRDGDGSHPRLKRAPRSLAGAGGAIVEAASQRVTRLARGGGPPNASPSNRRMPEPNMRDRNSYGSCVHEFRTAKLRRGFRVFAQDQVRRGWSKIIAIFPMGSDF